jgi:DNA repair protein RecO (recombination protein O)
VALYRSDAFVLRTYKLGEADQIVVLFTKDYGKVRAVVRRSRSARRQTASYYQPLMLLHAILFGRPTQSLHRLNGVDIVHSFRALREDFEAMRCGLYMTELIEVATREREPVPELFALLYLGLEQLTQTVHPHMLLRLFELRLLGGLGYTPQLCMCVGCGGDVSPTTTTFSAVLGGLVCSSCAARVRPTLAVHPETLAYMRLALTHDADTSLPLPGEPVVHQELEQLLHAHLTACLGRELKSYAFLHL